MTSGKEDYLKALYALGYDGHTVSNKEIADMLRVSPPSVSEMIVKLQKEGYIDYTAYKGSRLTEKGRIAASRLLRYYGLWEVFLVRCLGFRWSEAHTEAHALEHHISEKAANALDDFLGCPAYCPHGMPIPRRDGTRAPDSARTLLSLEPGSSACICRCEDDIDLMDYLQDSGIRMGMDIVMKEKAPYEGPVIFLSDGKEYTLSYKAASQLYIR